MTQEAATNSLRLAAIPQHFIRKKSLMTKRLLTAEQVIAATGMKKTFIYDHMKKGTFPKNIKIGAAVRWLESEVQDWIDAQVAANRKAA